VNGEIVCVICEQPQLMADWTNEAGMVDMLNDGDKINCSAL
jgi:hypothetical protein